MNRFTAIVAAALLAIPLVGHAQELGTDCPPGTTYQGLVHGEESGGNYQVMNPNGKAAGAYQFMPATLKDLGYISSLGADGGYSGAVWTGKGGVNSIQQFLNSPHTQDTAFGELTQKNLESVAGDWSPGDTVNGVPLTEGGVALVVHMTGPGGFRAWKNGGFTPGAIMDVQAAANGGAQAMHDNLMNRLARGSCADPNIIIPAGNDNIGELPEIFLMPWQPEMRSPVIKPGTFRNLST